MPRTTLEFRLSHRYVLQTSVDIALLITIALRIDTIGRAAFERPTTRSRSAGHQISVEGSLYDPLSLA